jgi:pyrimidine-nucleoside phosphorylase
MMRAVDIIAKKRDGQELDTHEMEWFIQGLVNGEVADYQAAAWAMAVLLRGMSERETIDLTMAMVRSGESGLGESVSAKSGRGRTRPRRVVDKHSTGGVGDKTTLVVAPWVAAAGLPVAKMSGRGLGYSGGTLDKLEAIPGMRVDLTQEQFLRQAREIGIVVAGQTADLAPADGILYALRDVTATVPSLPLIASSIMSKKIAGGADAIVLDVKVGRGAFMETLPEARELATLMMRIGQGVGRQVTAVLADMSQPLGRAVGNALEVREAIETLRGQGPAAFAEHCLVIAAEMLLLGGIATDPPEARERLKRLLGEGQALEMFRRWVAAQGGDARVAEEPQRLPAAPVVRVVEAPRAGAIAGIDAREVGLAVVALGGGRQRKGEAIDPSVGVVLHAKVGDRVAAGAPLFTVHAADEDAARAAEARLLAAYRWSEEDVAAPPAIYELLRDPAVL